MPDHQNETTSLVGIGPLTTLASGAPFLEEAVILWSRLKPDLTSAAVFKIDEALTGPTVEIEIVLQDGRPEVNEVKVSRRPGEPEITPTMLREIPLSRIAEHGVVQMELIARAMWAESSIDSPGPIGQESHPYYAPVTESVAARRRRTVTDELLREVAAVYQTDTTGAPTKAVREHFPTSQRNAARYVALAKERGFITNQTEDQS
jgi:hypothetical protein